MTPCPRKGKWIGGCRAWALYACAWIAVVPVIPIYVVGAGAQAIGDFIQEVAWGSRLVQWFVRHSERFVGMAEASPRCGEIKKREQP